MTSSVHSQEVRSIVNRAYQSTESLLKENADKLRTVSLNSTETIPSHYVPRLLVREMRTAARDGLTNHVTTSSTCMKGGGKGLATCSIEMVTRQLSASVGVSPPLLQLAEALLEREVLNYSDIVELLGPMPHAKKLHHQHKLADLW